MTEQPTTPEPVAEELHAELLDQLERPAVPLVLRQPRFLEGIYEHAAEAAAEPLRPVLEAGLTPSTAPADACWHEVGEPADMPDRVAAALPDSPAPGWLWARIQADMRRQRAAFRAGQGTAHRSAHRLGVTRISRVRLAAAAILIGVGLFGLTHGFGPLFSPQNGTLDLDHFVWEEEDKGSPYQGIPLGG